MTTHLIGENELSMMKQSAFLVNTSRGPVVKEQALIKALKEKEIAGAGLDVFEFEPIVSPELTEMDNVILLPHIGSAAVETRESMSEQVFQNLVDFFSGRKPKNIV